MSRSPKRIRTPFEMEMWKRTRLARESYRRIFNYYLSHHNEATVKEIAVVFKCSPQKISAALTYCFKQKRTKPYITR